jgi:hypothetical protein
MAHGFYSFVFLRLPLGAGSKGVRLNVTVRVTTWRTLTERAQALRGESKYRAVPSTAQSAEKGVRTLLGDSPAGEYMGDAGIRNRRREVGVRADRGCAKGDAGGIETVGDLWSISRRRK